MQENKKRPTVEDYNNENTIKFNTKESDSLKKSRQKDEEEVEYVRPTKVKKKRSRKLLVFLLIVLLIVVGFLGYGKYQEYKQNKAEEALNDFDTVDLYQTPIQEDVSSPILTNEKALENYSEDVIGYIQIPSVGMKVPIYQAKSGAEADVQNVMHYSVGHDPDSLLPGEKQKVVFTGHREEQFNKLQYVQKGDLVIVTILDNVFLYEIDELKIGEADDQEIIDYVYNYNNKDELIMYTCYPFKKYAPVEKRFIVHAKRVSYYDKEIDIRVEEDNKEE